MAVGMYGPPRFALIYFASGLLGKLRALVVHGKQAVSGGASGALFVFLWRERTMLDHHEFRYFSALAVF